MEYISCNKITFLFLYPTSEQQISDFFLLHTDRKLPHNPPADGVRLCAVCRAQGFESLRVKMEVGISKPFFQDLSSLLPSLCSAS